MLDISSLNINHVNKHRPKISHKKSNVKVDKNVTIASIKPVTLAKVLDIIQRYGSVSKEQLLIECVLHITTINNAIIRLVDDGNISKVKSKKEGRKHVTYYFIKGT